LSPCRTGRGASVPSGLLLVWTNKYGSNLTASELGANSSTFVELIRLSQTGGRWPRRVLITGDVILNRRSQIVKQPDGGYLGDGFGLSGQFMGVLVVRRLEFLD